MSKTYIYPDGALTIGNVQVADPNDESASDGKCVLKSTVECDAVAINQYIYREKSPMFYMVKL